MSVLTLELAVFTFSEISSVKVRKVTDGFRERYSEGLEEYRKDSISILPDSSWR